MARLATPFLPLLPSEAGLSPLRPLWRYLGKRDLGPPTNDPVPSGLVQTALATAGGVVLVLETLLWDYQQATGEFGLAADGFLLLIDADVVGGPGGNSVTPVLSQVKIGAGSRSYQTWWPVGAVRSYAIAAYRTTYNGESTGPIQALDKHGMPIWQAVT